MQSSAEEEPSDGLYVPDEQGVGDVAALVLTKCPGGESMQAEAPELGWNVPRSHAV